jgi:Zn finger protein HypA/HybF involved in hydrogenase expression
MYFLRKEKCVLPYLWGLVLMMKNINFIFKVKYVSTIASPAYYLKMSNIKRNIEGIIEWHEKDIGLSFAVAQSQDKLCGVCLETVWEKALASRQAFRLLPNCVHMFCLDCVRSWRQTQTLENEVVKSCPGCRVHSNFVFPSRYWIESKEEKERLITEYKQTLRSKNVDISKEEDASVCLVKTVFIFMLFPLIEKKL